MGSRVVIVTAVLIAAAIFGWHWIWLRWGAVVTGWGTYSSVLEWLDQAMLLLWALLLALCISLGFLVVMLARPARGLVIGTASGVLLGLVLILRAKLYFTADTAVSTYVWSYGLYLMAPVGAWIGARIAVLAKRRFTGQAAV